MSDRLFDIIQNIIVGICIFLLITLSGYAIYIFYTIIYETVEWKKDCKTERIVATYIKKEDSINIIPIFHGKVRTTIIRHDTEINHYLVLSNNRVWRIPKTNEIPEIKINEPASQYCKIHAELID